MMHATTWYRVRSLNDLGTAIRSIRETGEPQTQQQFAETIGSSRPTISRLERGNDVSSSVIWAGIQELGYELVLVPRGARVTIEQGQQ